jgi:predicted nucleic acid-binding protein
MAADDTADFPLIRRYQAWIEPDGGVSEDDRELFYSFGMIVLDTNVLLDLYRYTPEAREEILEALRRVADRLWMPYQVGLEFVRGRNKVIHDRTRLLGAVAQQVRQGFDQAWQDIASATAQVKQLLANHANDQEGQRELDELINQESFRKLTAPWMKELITRAEEIKNSQDVQLGSLVAGPDRVLHQVAELYGDRIGEPPSNTDLERRVQKAARFRYPNRIPPGFADAAKGTDLAAAGDFLLWEEVVRQARGLPTPRRVLFVSGDAKEDWYEPSTPGRKKQPWPHLFEEMRRRAHAELLLVRPQDFFKDVREYLNADIAQSTVEEIEKAADSRDGQDRTAAVLTEQQARALTPPEELLLEACRAAELPPSVVRYALSGTDDYVFKWWLIGATAELDLREVTDDDFSVDLDAAVIADAPPDDAWVGGKVFPPGQWPYRTSSWIAPWFVGAVKSVPLADRGSLLRLEVRRINAHSMRDENPVEGAPGRRI